MKKVSLEPDEWQRLVEISDEEMKAAMIKLAQRIHLEIHKRKFNLEHGPFSFGAMGGDAIKIISKECCEALMNGEWHWKKGRKLITQLTYIAKSKMGHIIRDYYRNGCPEVLMESNMTYQQQQDMEAAEQWDMEINMRDLGYDMARKAVKGIPEFERYVEALYDVNSYDFMVNKLGMESENEVWALERKVLKYLNSL